MSYWVNIFDERQASSAMENLRQGSVVSVNTNSVSFVANFGNKKEGEKWGETNQKKPTQESKPQSKPSNQPFNDKLPVDFDDDILF